MMMHKLAKSVYRDAVSIDNRLPCVTDRLVDGFLP